MSTVVVRYAQFLSSPFATLFSNPEMRCCMLPGEATRLSDALRKDPLDVAIPVEDGHHLQRPCFRLVHDQV